MTLNDYEEKSVRVPYRERRAVKKYLVPRLVRRRRRKLIRFTIFLCALILIPAIAVVSSSLTENRKDEVQTEQKIVPKNEAPDQTAKITDALLFVYSVDRKKISKYAICSFERETGSLTVILFGENIYYPLLGIGIMDPASLTPEFLDSLYASVKNGLIYEISGPFKVSTADLDEDNLRKSPNRLIDSLKKLNNSIKPDSSLSIKSAEIIPAPTRLTKVGDRTVMVVDQDKLNEAADILFSGKYPERQARASVIIINGSGLPGAGSKASVRLVLSGFNVKAVKNAEKFDQLVTEIRTEKEDIAKKIQDALGCGEVKKIEGGSSVSDAVIILGKDFRGFND
jgi:hypothetical protein